PKARLKEGLALAETGAITSSIDSSDGLAWSLHEVADASGVGFLIEDIPVAPEVKEIAERCGLDPVELSLYGGEEYELILTIKPELWDEVERIMEEIGTPFTIIGRVIEERRLVLKIDGRIEPIKRRGWEHFRSKQ
ncbi:thiamine-phosphate kinase, partial [Candidatus Bathyarchaeota archaeon]